jgi:hypothetical protein
MSDPLCVRNDASATGAPPAGENTLCLLLRPGDSLDKIAARTGLPASEIQRQNPQVRDWSKVGGAVIRLVLDEGQPAGSGLVIQHDTSLRSAYQKQIAATAGKAVEQIGQARERGDLAAAERIAREASAARNVARASTQDRVSPGGRALSKAIETPKTFAELERNYARPNRFDTLATIAAKSGQSRAALKGVVLAGKVLGPVATVGGVALGVRRVVKAPPEQKPRAVAAELGGVAGGAVGSSVGTSAAVVAGVAIGATGVGAVALALGGGMVGGIAGSATGRRAAGKAYDAAASAVQEVRLAFELPRFLEARRRAWMAGGGGAP